MHSVLTVARNKGRDDGASNFDVNEMMYSRRRTALCVHPRVFDYVSALFSFELYKLCTSENISVVGQFKRTS